MALAASKLTTDWWIATSRDGGGTWAETHLSGPFDLRNALLVRGNEDRDRGSHYFLGHYFGLVSMAGGFGATFIEARDPRDDATNQTDVMFARARHETSAAAER